MHDAVLTLLVQGQTDTLITVSMASFSGSTSARNRTTPVRATIMPSHWG